MGRVLWRIKEFAIYPFSSLNEVGLEFEVLCDIKSVY